MMQKRVAAFFLAITVAIGGTAHAARPTTRKCNTNWQARDIGIQFTNTVTRDALVFAANNPGRDPDGYARLGQPKSGQAIGFFTFAYFSYDFDLLVDVDEVAQAIASDPVLASRGVVSASSDHFGACFATLPANPAITLTEYHNRILDHYFLSSSSDENQAIDSGAAGPGWERTGETFRTLSMDSCRGVLPVFRFYGSGFNSHFFTVDSAECGAVHNSDPGWIFEGNAFGAMMPADGACPARTVTVYRLYNNRAQAMDSNHRYVVRPELYAQMMARGWIGEGVAMCLPQSP